MFFIGIMFSSFVSSAEDFSQDFSEGLDITKEGTIEVIHVDFNDGEGEFIYYLKTGDGKRYKLASSGKMPIFRSGTKIKIEGKLMGEELIKFDASTLSLESVDGEGGGGYLESRFIDNIGEQKTLVILVDVNEFKVSSSINQIENIFFGENSKSVNDFFDKNSFGKAYFSGEAIGPFHFIVNLDETTGKCFPPSNEDILLKTKTELLKAGKKLEDYSRIFFIFDKGACRDQTGSGTIGKADYLVGEDQYSFSVSSIFLNPNSDTPLSIFIHELGHNFGIGHANSFECYDLEGNLVPYSYNCKGDEYGDPVSPMGWSVNYHNNAAHKWDIGWLTEENIAIVPEEGNEEGMPLQWEYDLRPLEIKLSSGIQMIQIPIDISPTYGSGDDLYYTIDFRQPLDYDEGLNQLGASQGVFIRFSIFKKDYTLTTYLLGFKTNPQLPSLAKDFILEVGEDFTDEINGYKIRLMDISGEGRDAIARVRIERIPKKQPNFDLPIVSYNFDEEGLSVLLEAKMDKTVVKDSAGYTIDGVIRGSKLNFPEYKFGGLYFQEEDNVLTNEVNGHLTIPIYPLPFAYIKENKKFTFSIWVNPQDYPSFKGKIFSSVYGEIIIDSSGIINFNFFGKRLSSKMPLSLNEWYNIVGIYNGDRMMLYINGINHDSINFQLSDEDFNVNSLFIPEASLGGIISGFSSESIIDNLQIYAKAFSEQELREKYTNFRPKVEAKFFRGDANGEGRVDLSDAVSILDFLFKDGNRPKCFDAADVNDDGYLDIADPIKLLFTLFQGGTIPDPYLSEGQDITPDKFTCEEESEKKSVLSCSFDPDGYWKFDNGEQILQENLIYDSSNNFLNGIFRGGFSSKEKWVVEGKIGTALSFNPFYYHYVSILNSDSLNPGTESFSISFWVDSDGSDSEVRPVMKRDNEDIYFLGHDKTGFVFGLKDIIDGQIKSTYARGGILKPGNWHHVVGVRDTSLKKIILYVDGEKVKEADDFTNEISPTGLLTFGKDPSFSGKIEEVSIFKKGLSYGEVLEIYDNGNGLELC